jgi:catechol 2,3-dioxygenase-like lactoylglutathione lyase family enzyme
LLRRDLRSSTSCVSARTRTSGWTSSPSAAQLGSDGVQLITEPGPLQTAGGGYGFRFFDIDGRAIEISSDVATRVHRRIEERESIPVRLSHVVVNSPTPERTVAFYEKHLGFQLSDTLTAPNGVSLLYFLRCDDSHHNIAVARGPHASLQHLSFELRGIDEFMRGTGRVMRAGVRSIWGPGRHRAGDNTFSYFSDPHGNTVEYTNALMTIDEDNWHPNIYNMAEPENEDDWGTANPYDDFVSSKMFNDPDEGLFVAPPV